MSTAARSDAIRLECYKTCVPRLEPFRNDAKF